VNGVSDLLQRAGAGGARACRTLRTRRARRIIRRAGVGAALTMIALATLIAFTMVSLIPQAPTWWRSLDADDPETEALGEAVEQGVISKFMRDRPLGEPWTIGVRASEANAWLNTKLRKWLINRELGWPEMLAEIQANFENGRVSLGFLIVTEDGEQIVAATAEPMVDERGALWLPISATRAGRLDVPHGWTIARLRDWMPREMLERASTQRLLDALAGAEPLTPSAAFEIDSWRQARLLRIGAQRGRLLLTCVTERSGAVASGDDRAE